MFHTSLLVSWPKCCWYIDIHPSLFGDNLSIPPHKKWNSKLRFTWVLQRATSMSSSYFSSDTDPVIAKWIYTFSKILLTRLLNLLEKIFKSQRLNYVYWTVQVLRLLLSDELSLEGVLSECWIKRLPSCNQVGLGHYIWKVQ